MKKIIVVMALILLTGCAKEPDPVTAINDQLQQDVAQLIDYANNNMADDSDTQLLKTGLKDCVARADAATKQHETSIKQCQAETSKARTERNTLALVLILLVAIKLFNIRL
jgi:uncharacterized membrane protein YvbJ